MDRIRIRDLLVRAILGVNDDERREKQDVLINITLHADLSRPCRSDRFEDTVDYRAVKKRVAAMVEESRFFLVEALAQAIADICLEDPMAAAADVRVEKMAALRFARSVGVEITRERKGLERAFISVGSNVQPEENVLRALHTLSRRTLVKGVSTVYRTKAVDRPGQPEFYNCVVELATGLGIRDLKESLLRTIEDELGRVRGPDKFAPRTVDLDLIALGAMPVTEEGITLPDPDIKTRPWLAVGLAELAPELELFGTTAEQIASRAGCGGLEPLRAFTDTLREELYHAMEH